LFDRAGSRKYLNATERGAFFRAAKNEAATHLRAFMLTLLFTGCRISEALNLPIKRIDFAEKTLVFETLKRRTPGHFRSVPVPDDLLDLLRTCARGKKGTARVWGFSRPTGYRLVKLYMARARITGAMASPKGLRHGFAIACVEEKIPLTTIRKWLGHARLETTAIYLEFAGQEERQLAKRLWKNLFKKAQKRLVRKASRRSV